jgi:autotransporter-associated beta strand protein
MIGPVSAATWIWDGGGPNNRWTTATNWEGNTAPPSGTQAYLILTGVGNNRPTNPNQPFSIACLTYNSSTTTAFTITGANTVTLTGTVPTQLYVDPSAAGHTISCPVALGTSQAWELDSSNPFTVSGVISDGSSTYGITKTGPGTLIFTGTDTYNGLTTISEGTLRLGDGVKTGLILPTANQIDNEAALIYTTPSTITHSGVISGAGTFTKSGSGTLDINRHQYLHRPHNGQCRDPAPGAGNNRGEYPTGFKWHPQRCQRNI